MSTSTSRALTNQAFERKLKLEAELARRKWRGDSARTKASATKYTIAISRESGAGGGAVACEVGRILDWPVYDRELLEHIAEETGLRSELLESLDEKRSNWLTEVFESWSQAAPMSGAGYAQHMARTILALASHGHCVIVGRGSTVIIPANVSVRVRLVASLDVRTERICKRLGVSKVEAIGHVRLHDAHRDGFVKDYFQRKVGDPHDYDLTINTSRFTVEESAKLIIDALRQLEARNATGILERSVGTGN